MGVREWPTKPLELVSIDYLTELPRSARNNIHLLVINDQLSKFIQVYAIKDITVKTASNWLFYNYIQIETRASKMNYSNI